jgi:Rab5 GDP/GTP exchange factor
LNLAAVYDTDTDDDNANDYLMESTSQVLHDHPIASILFDQTTQTPVNPWTDATDFDDKNPQVNNEDIPLRTPDPELLDQSIVAGIQAEESPIDTKVSNDILSQFDPLASLEEEAAREAWNTSESHPPPPRSPSAPTTPPFPPVKDAAAPPPPELSQGQPSGSSSFPSLAALARTFAIPALSRPRPVSLDAAKPVPSPATLSSFEVQQDTARDNSTTTQNGSATRPSSQSRNGTPSPATGGKESDEIPFDFQKFLDQMKSRNAEPVSKYLRSYVIPTILSL